MPKNEFNADFTMAFNEANNGLGLPDLSDRNESLN